MQSCRRLQSTPSLIYNAVNPFAAWHCPPHPPPFPSVALFLTLSRNGVVPSCHLELDDSLPLWCCCLQMVGNLTSLSAHLIHLTDFWQHLSGTVESDLTAAPTPTLQTQTPPSTAEEETDS